MLASNTSLSPLISASSIENEELIFSYFEERKSKFSQRKAFLKEYDGVRICSLLK
mgnify:CR=1 FL=1